MLIGCQAGKTWLWTHEGIFILVNPVITRASGTGELMESSAI